VSTSTQRFPQPRPPDDADPVVIADRFEIRDELRRTASTVTATALDRETGETVVVKRAHAQTLARATRIRLLHEADVLRSLGGDLLVPLLASGESDGVLYFVMPLVPGRPLRERLVDGPIGSERTLAVAANVLGALSAAHQRGVLHRDVKPSNVLVTDDEPPVARLVDWGLARSDQLDASIRDDPVGTARYMSPEQAGMVGHEVDERSDLYSVGVLLYECLTGTPPFTGETVGEVLRQHLSSEPPDPRGVDGTVPTALAALVRRLLRKDPRDRYQTADGALADITTIREALAGGDPDPAVVLGAHDIRSSLTEPAFVGREAELARVTDAIAAAATGAGGVVLVEAESGGGKSRLLDEVRMRVKETGSIVLHGQAVDQAARLPYVLLDGVIRDLAAVTAEDPELLERLRDSLAGDVDSVVAALPQIEPLLMAHRSHARPAPEEFGQVRTLAALTHLFDCLGDSGRVTVMLLDDCQWADDAMVALLTRWQREREGASRPSTLVVVAAFRSEEVAADAPLRNVSSNVVTLRPLDAGDVGALVESMAGVVPPAVVAAVQRLSDGSPFMASAVLRGLSESGALYFDTDHWAVDESLLESVQSSRESAVVLARRLELLPADALELLQVGAVLGKRFDVETAARLAAVHPDEAVASLHLVESRHIVWLEAGGAAAAFVHDKLRETLLGRLDGDRRQALHRAIAEDLEGSGAASAYDLAFHFASAGDPGRALPHALTAAAEARARHSLAAAEQQYRIARDGLRDTDVEARFTVEVGLADVLMLKGGYAESEHHLKQALEVAATRPERAEIERRLGELAFKRGDIPESVDYLEAAIRALGRRVPRRHITYTLCALWEALVQVVHTILPSRWIARRSLEGAEDDLLAARIYSRLAYSYWFSKGREPCGWAHLREMNLLERFPPTLELAQAYSEHAPVASTLPWYSRGIDYAKRSLKIREDFEDLWGQGQSLHFYGVVLYASSRFEESVDRLHQAIRLLERTGDQWEINTALWHIGLCWYRLGDIDASRRAFERCRASATEIGDHQALGISLAGLSKISGGDVDAAPLAAALVASAGDVHTTGELVIGEAVRLLRLGRAAAAVDLLADGHRKVAKAKVRNEYVAPMLPWLTTALRTMAENTSPYDAQQRAALLRRARRTAWRARVVAAAYRNNLPHVLREQACIALLQGRRRSAERLIDRGLQLSDSLSMPLERESFIALQRRDSVPKAATFVNEAPEDGPSLSLADRFDAILTVGRSIATALTQEAVWDAVRSAAAELLRGDDISVVLIEPGDGGRPRLVPVDASDHSTSEQFVRRALDVGEVVSWTDDEADPTESMLLNRTRSALAAPVYRRGEIVGCWCTSHRSVGSLFGPDEVRLAEFISALAGAALENAEGFAEVQALSRTLEQRVIERTAELEQANHDLRRLDELKSEFVAMTSHELRSPLTSILGFCRTVLRRWELFDDAKKFEIMTTIERQGSRLAALTDDLLQMARIESGHVSANLTPVEVLSLCDEVVADFEGRSTGITVGGDAAVALADREHLCRVVINLIDNALKYGEAPVELTVGRVGDRVRLVVRDHGAGVPEEFVPRLFDRFAQASSGVTRQSTGTGLGMAIVRGLMDAMSGTITYEAAEGGGAAFVVELPATGD